MSSCMEFGGVRVSVDCCALFHHILHKQFLLLEIHYFKFETYFERNLEKLALLEEMRK